MVNTLALKTRLSEVTFKGSLGWLGWRLYLLLLAAVDMYAVLLLSYFLLRLTVGDRFWGVGLRNNFIQWLLLPSLICLPVLLLRRHWWRGMMVAPLPVVFLLLYGGLWLPASAQAAPEDAITVLSYNVADLGVKPNDLVAYIRQTDPDIVGLVEFGPEQAAAIERDLTDDYPYQILNPIGVPGKALLSRYPIREFELVTFGPTSPFIHATVEVNGRELTVWVVHPPRPNLTRDFIQPYTDDTLAKDMEQLLTTLTPDQPLLMLGDFNLTDQSHYHQQMEDLGLTDSFLAVGHGFGATFPAVVLPFPLVRIDYVWVSPHLQPLTAQVGEDIGSDHLPLLVQVAWSD